MVKIKSMTNKLTYWTTKLILFFITSFFPLFFLASYFQMGLQGIGINLVNIFVWTSIIALISFLIFLTLHKLSYLKFFNFGLFNFLLALLVGSGIFSIFAWFYFPHYNERGYRACDELSRSSIVIGVRKENLGKIGDFVKNYGQASSIREHDGYTSYTYSSPNNTFCSLEVTPSGTIESAGSWII